MNARVVQRLADTFFRRWWLFVLPVLLFLAAGVARSFDTQKDFRSVGVIDVSQGTLLSKLTQLRGEVFGYETPATATARTMGSLLGTDNFIESVAEKAGVTGALERGELTPLVLRSSISTGTNGDTLLAVAATTADPELSARLAQGTIDSFIQYTVDAELAESQSAETFFVEQAEQYRLAVEQAQDDLTAYATANPGGPLDERPLEEQIEIERLQSQIDLAKEQYTAAQQKVEEARLATDQTNTDVAQRLRVIDAPSVPSAPEPRLRDAIFTTVTFGIMGLMISAFALVLVAFADRSLRSPADVEDGLGVRALAVVPEEKARRSSRSERKASGEPTSPSSTASASPNGAAKGASASSAAAPTTRPVSASSRASS